MHVGVRNYTFALKALLESRGHTVHLVIRDADGHWYGLAFTDPEFEQNNGAADLRLEGPPAQMMLRFYSQTGGKPRIPMFRTALGAAFPPNWFDLCIITAPWCVRFEERLPCATVLGLVHDVIPNIHALVRDTHPFAFADEHRAGYQYYLRHCDGIIVNSMDTAASFQRFFGTGCPVTALPPLVPKRFLAAPAPTCERNKSLLLAGPLDPRKGLAQLPSFINALRLELDSVTMFGAMRCRETEALDFFRTLRIDNLVWYPQISAAALVALYGQSRLMLFPSTEEGLGIPLIEAQWMGARVVVRNKSPMRDLAQPGSIFLAESPLQDGAAAEAEQYGAILREALVDDGFDHAGLAAATRQRFDPRFAWMALAGLVPALAV